MLLNTPLLSNPGMKNLNAIIEKWANLSNNIKLKEAPKPIILPDMLWKTPAGIGKTKLLGELVTKLEQFDNLMDFYGDVKFFEFYLGYTSPDQPFSELSRLVLEVQNAAGYRNEFAGIIHIDISEWVGRTDQKHFKAFLEYIADNSDNWLIILSVPNKKDEATEKLESILSVYLRLEIVEFETPNYTFFMKVITEYLINFEMELDKNAHKIINDSVKVLLKSDCFDGYKTINMLCSDIVYSLYSKNPRPSSPITAELVKDFASDSAYIKRLIYKNKTKYENKIGF